LNAELIDAVDLSIGRANKVVALQRELQERGYFDWRTWSGKKNARVGRWKVKIVFADNTPVPCQASLPCDFVINVGTRAER
jgi:hypothetical protein